MSRFYRTVQIHRRTSESPQPRTTAVPAKASHPQCCIACPPLRPPVRMPRPRAPERAVVGVKYGLFARRESAPSLPSTSRPRHRLDCERRARDPAPVAGLDGGSVASSECCSDWTPPLDRRRLGHPSSGRKEPEQLPAGYSGLRPGRGAGDPPMQHAGYSRTLKAA